MPGFIRVTVIFLLATSALILWVKPLKPNFAAEYKLPFFPPSSADSEPIYTNLPLFFFLKKGTKYLVKMTWDKRLVLIELKIWSTEKFSKFPK